MKEVGHWMWGALLVGAMAMTMDRGASVAAAGESGADAGAASGRMASEPVASGPAAGELGADAGAASGQVASEPASSGLAVGERTADELAAGVTAASATAAREPTVAAHPVLEDRYPERRTPFPQGVVGLADLVYSVVPGFRPLRLDLYEPAGKSGSHGLVVFIHGGGWVSGHTRHSGAFENWPGVLASLAAKGYVVASVEYRLSGEARFPAAIQDIKASIRWLRAHASEYGIDKTRAVVWGGSAGGQLAALAAMSCGAEGLEPPRTPAAQTGGGPAKPRAEDNESDCVQGLIAWYGIFDFATLARQSDAAGQQLASGVGQRGAGADGKRVAGAAQQIGAAGSAPSQYLGCALASCSGDELAAASAAHYVDSKDPPALLIHGTNDRTVPVQQSRDFYALLKSKGVSVEFVEIPGVDHSFIGSTPQATRAASLQALQKSFAFIDQTIGGAR